MSIVVKLSREMFLNELLETNEDVMSEYFYKIFNEYYQKYFYNCNYMELTYIELLFRQVLEINYKKDIKNNLEILMKKANEGIEFIDEILKRDDKYSDYLYGYLIYKKSDFYYYLGHNTERWDSELVKEYMEKAIDGYKKCAELLKFDDIFNNHVVQAGFLGTQIDYRRVAAYHANAIGSAYNRMKLDDYSKSEQYCARAIELAGDPFSRERYIRNYGVALEKNGKQKEAKAQYEKAYNIFGGNKNNLHCLLSVLDKLIGKKLQIQGFVSPDENRNPPLGSVEHINQIKQNAAHFEDVEGYVNELKEYYEIARTKFPDDTDSYKYEIIYCRDYLILGLCSGIGVDVNKLLESAEKALKILTEKEGYHEDENGKKHNPLTKVLTNDIDALKTIVKEKYGK